MLSKEAEKLLREQNFRGKEICFFSGTPESEIPPFLKKRMAKEVFEGKTAPCDYVVSWNYSRAHESAFLRKNGKALRGKGKFIFLISGGEKPPFLDEFFGKYGFLVTRQFVMKISETSGISYSRTAGSPKESFLFLVAEKLGD